MEIVGRWAGWRPAHIEEALGRPGGQFLFLFERGRVTPKRRRDRRLPGSNSASSTRTYHTLVHGVRAGTCVWTPRKAMECAGPPFFSDGWLCLRDLTSRSESHSSANAPLYPATPGSSSTANTAVPTALISSNRIPAGTLRSTGSRYRRDRLGSRYFSRGTRALRFIRTSGQFGV